MNVIKYNKLVWKRLYTVKVKVAQSCPNLCECMDYSPWNSPGQNVGVGSLSLLQGMFPSQGSNAGLPVWKRLYTLHDTNYTTF